MATHTDGNIERAYGQIADEYARRGYRVLRPRKSDQLPGFLRDCRPDLIVEKGNDRAVVEVKRTRSLRAANDLRQLAARIAAEPGWRLELVSPAREADELAPLREPGWLDRMLHQPERFSSEPEVQDYYTVYQATVLEVLLSGLASLNHVRMSGKSANRIAQDLAFHGVIEQDTYERIQEAMTWRNCQVHGWPLPRSAASQSTELDSLCRELHGQVLREANLSEQV